MAQIEVTEDMLQVDADILARAFGISPDDLKRGMREGTITGRAERGDGDDAGRVRLTFYSSGRRVRITADKGGKVLACDAATIENSPDPDPDPGVARRARLEALLDEALDESFPASDPIAVSFGAPGRATSSSKKTDDG